MQSRIQQPQHRSFDMTNAYGDLGQADFATGDWETVAFNGNTNIMCFRWKDDELVSALPCCGTQRAMSNAAKAQRTLSITLSGKSCCTDGRVCTAMPCVLRNFISIHAPDRKRKRRRQGENRYCGFDASACMRASMSARSFFRHVPTECPVSG